MLPTICITSGVAYTLKHQKTSVARNYRTYKLVIHRREEYGLCTTCHSIIMPSINRFSSRVLGSFQVSLQVKSVFFKLVFHGSK